MKLLIWDFDGTLAHRPSMWSGTLLHVLGEVHPGHQVKPEHLRPWLQTGFRWHAPEDEYPVLPAHAWWGELHPVFEQAYQAAGLDATVARRLAGEVQRHYTDPQHWEVYPDTGTTLEHLSVLGWRHVILTNHVPEFRELLKALGLSGHFLQVFNSAETGFEKPHPRAFRLVLESLGEAKQVCMIGDNIRADVQGARAVGLPAVLVRKNDPAAQWQCTDLSSLPGQLDAIFAD
ncbi:phosphoglycolate phosphatase [Deinococcus carri]|uniref:Phosphoglycolate phosphatase n=1 Tax=Deinococcus carri TaxID=1211323 RepID=A0ABP9W6L9_9DEIO